MPGRVIGALSPTDGGLRIETDDCNSSKGPDPDAGLTVLGGGDAAICGMLSDAGIEATARGAAAPGDAVTLAADAHTTHAWNRRDFRGVIADTSERRGRLDGVSARPVRKLALETEAMRIPGFVKTRTVRKR